MAGTSPKMSFNNLPNESGGGLEPGVHTLKVVTATKELSKKGKPMLTVTVSPTQKENLKIYDRFVLFNENYEPESFGQYKLKKFLEAVQYIPEGEFTIERLTSILPGMTFKAKLENEEGQNGKKYLSINDVESYAPAGEEKSTNPAEEAPEESPEDLKNIDAELENDDDIV